MIWLHRYCVNVSVTTFSGSRPDFTKAHLSDREKEVLMLICRELTIREIAQKLFLSENTVRNHRVNIMEKIGTHNTVGMVKYAYDSGLIT
jgi:two-component system response regulator DegU